MTRGFLSQPLAVFAVAMTVTLATVLLDVSVSATIDELFKEGRAIELLSALWLLAAAVLWAALGTGDAMRRHWHVPVLLLLMAMREQDYDKRFLADGILKLRLYTGPAPLADKLIGLAVLALLAVCLWRLLRLSLPGWLAGLRRGQTAPWLVLASGATLVVAKTVDGLGRKLEPFGIALDRQLEMMLGRGEEMLELAAAVMLVQAVVCHAQGDWLRVARGAGVSTEAAVGRERMPASLRVPERSSR